MNHLLFLVRQFKQVILQVCHGHLKLSTRDHHLLGDGGVPKACLARTRCQEVVWRGKVHTLLGTDGR